ncbi:hypothetical protein G9A89_012420 [Geosiphon pyriformis]|nr:hypothetical protein G9A89_012420 [Geosiphon pyriformis]
MSGPSVKRRSARVSTTGLVGGGSGHKIKKPPGGAKLLSSNATLESGRSGRVVGEFNGMDTDGEASEGEEVPDFKMNMSQAKHFNNDATVGSPLSSINYDIEEEEEVSLSPLEMAVKKSFALDINLLAVEGKSTMAKTQTALLARANNIIVNSDLKRQGVHSDQAVVIKEIPIDTPKKMIIAAVSVFGEIKSIKIQLIGMWQKAVVEFAKSGQAEQLASKWSFLIGKDSVHVAKAVRDHNIWASRDCFRVLLFTLPVGTTAHDLSNLLDRTSGRTCIINCSLDTGNRVHCAVVGFESENDLNSTFLTKPVFGGVHLSWAKLDLVWCGKCGHLGHLALECDASDMSSSDLLNIFNKRCASGVDCLQLAKLYAKKNVPISHSAAFGSKSWIQVVSLASPSGGSPSGSGLGVGFPFHTTSDLGSGPPSFTITDSSLNARLASLEHSLELLADQVSGILRKLSFVELVLMVPSSGAPLLVGSMPLAPVLDFDMALNGKLASSNPHFPSVDMDAGFNSSSSKILTTKVDGLESKMSALEASVSSVLARLDLLCSGSGLNNSAKQADVVCWHFDMVFTSGLDSGCLGSGVAIVMNNSLAKHVYKISEVSGWLLSIRLLFKNKLSVSVLGLYAGASSSVRFSQAGDINSLIAKAVNESSFVVLGGDFNEDGTRKSASFKKCSDLGLVNALSESVLTKMPTWGNSHGVVKTIDYMLISSSLINAVVDCDMTGVKNFFDTDHKAVSVSVGLGGLLDS